MSAQSSDFGAELKGRSSLYLLLHPSSNSFQSCASFSLDFFYLILQRIRPLIYSADIARKPKHPARNVDSAIVRRTGVKPKNEYLLDFTGRIWTDSHTCMDCYQTDFFDISIFYQP
jgi:hypothetical protein